MTRLEELAAIHAMLSPFPIRSFLPSGNAPAGFSPSRSEPLCPVAVSSETGANSPVGMDDSRPGPFTDISAQTFGWAQWMRYRNG